jgi:peroxiredoxin
MFRAVRPLFAVLAAVLLVSACTGSDAVDQSGTGGTSNYEFTGATPLGKLIPESSRKPAANFKAKLLDGGTIKLASTRGKVVVLSYWASWCGPCKTETPQFDLLYRSIKSKGVDFLGINTKDAKDAAKHFVRTNDITFPIVYDEPGETALRLGNLPTAYLPFTVLLDKAGKVAAVYVVRVSYNDLQTSVEKLLAET